MSKNKYNTTGSDNFWIAIIIIVMMLGIANMCRNNMVDRVMEDEEFRNDLDINNREEAEQFIDDHY